MFPKFIVTEDKILMGMVKYHKYLNIDNGKVLGGGWYRFSKDNTKIIFHGDSTDFGRAKFGDIEKLVRSGSIFLNGENISSDYIFEYDDGVEIINF